MSSAFTRTPTNAHSGIRPKRNRVERTGPATEEDLPTAHHPDAPGRGGVDSCGNPKDYWQARYAWGFRDPNDEVWKDSNAEFSLCKLHFRMTYAMDPASLAVHNHYKYSGGVEMELNPECGDKCTCATDVRYVFGPIFEEYERKQVTLLDARKAWLALTRSTHPDVEGAADLAPVITTLKPGEGLRRELDERAAWMYYEYLVWKEGVRVRELITLSHRAAVAAGNATGVVAVPGLPGRNPAFDCYTRDVEFRNGSLDKACCTFCHKHEAIGDFIPYASSGGYTRYRECGICTHPSKNALRMERNKEREHKSERPPARQESFALARGSYTTRGAESGLSRPTVTVHRARNEAHSMDTSGDTPASDFDPGTWKPPRLNPSSTHRVP